MKGLFVGTLEDGFVLKAIVNEKEDVSSHLAAYGCRAESS